MGREFDNVLNDCLDRISRGEDIERCIGIYPEHQEELVPLLRVAEATMQAARSASYSPEAKARGLTRLRQALAESGVPDRPRVPLFLRPAVKPLALGLAVVMLTAVAAGGTAVASSNSVPGEPLYWVKTTRENISLKLPRSDAEKARVHARLASERGQEMRQLIARGKDHEAERLVRRIRGHLNESALHAGIFLPANPIEMPVQARRFRMRPDTLRLVTSLERDGGALRADMAKLLGTVPATRKHRVQLIMRRSELGYRILIDAFNTDDSPRRPFWRIDPGAP